MPAAALKYQISLLLKGSGPTAESQHRPFFDTGCFAIQMKRACACESMGPEKGQMIVRKANVQCCNKIAYSCTICQTDIITTAMVKNNAYCAHYISQSEDSCIRMQQCLNYAHRLVKIETNVQNVSINARKQKSKRFPELSLRIQTTTEINKVYLFMFQAQFIYV